MVFYIDDFKYLDFLNNFLSLHIKKYAFYKKRALISPQEGFGVGKRAHGSRKGLLSGMQTYWARATRFTTTTTTTTTTTSVRKLRSPGISMFSSWPLD